MVLIGCLRDCYDTCGLRIHIESGKIVKVEANDDKFTQGVLCPRAAKDVERVYSSLRVLYPVVNIGGGVFKKVDWDNALDILVSKLKEVLEVYGAEKILFLEYAGNRGILTRYASRRLWNFLGVTQTDRSICNFSGVKALKIVYGSTYGFLPQEIDKLNMVIIWGFNPAVSAIHLWRRVLKIKERGGVVVTIDVRLTETAKQSTEFIKVKPASDGYLALGIAKYLIEKGYIDKEFVDKYTYGFKEFVKHLEGYGLDVVEKVTGVPKAKIIDLAEKLYTYKPFVILIGYGLQRRRGGGEIVRSISILPALLGIHRGFFYSNTDGLPINLAVVEGSDRWGPRRVVSMEKVAEELSKGSYKFVYIHLHNPAATLPNAGKLIESLLREDVFVVVHETHWSDTARLADLVLPAPTFYEKLDAVFSYSHNIVYLNKPVIDPLGESLGEYQLMCEIAKKVVPNNYTEICLDPYEVIKIAFGNEIFEKLLTEGFAELNTKPKDFYQTPSGKIEFYSTIAEKEGLPPLPTPPIGEDVGENELLLITSAHPLYMHTQFEDVYGSNQCELFVSPEDAQRFNITSGELVEVYNEKNSAILRIRIDPGLGRGIAWAPRQIRTYDGKRINVLLDDDVDKYGGSVLNSTYIKIRKFKQLTN